ncbi:MAG: hypothetical protein GY841_18610, partial [FCB group bacterium]|nr:hypothetical protein [FCB group bacterium]
DYYINGGIYRTDPRVMAWDFIDIPGRQDAGNIIYDIDPGEEVVWTANWWAGLKKSTDGGLSWESIVPDTTLFNPMDKHHHRIFSVAVSDEIICAGSQGGLNLSIDGGANWENLKHIDGQPSLTSDKIATTDFRDTGTNREIWAACWASISSGGTSGVSISSDTGQTWRTVLTGQKGWNFLFHQSDIFVACNSGLWFSANDGEDFINLTTSHLSSEVEIYEVEMTADSTLWIGTSDGLYRGGYGGEWWEKVDFISLDAADAGSRPTTFELGQNFPNPFNPATTIPVELERSSRIDLQVYDILGRRQKTVLSAILPAGSHDLI